MALRLGIDLKIFDAIAAQREKSSSINNASTENKFSLREICESSSADPLLIREFIHIIFCCTSNSTSTADMPNRHYPCQFKIHLLNPSINSTTSGYPPPWIGTSY